MRLGKKSVIAVLIAMALVVTASVPALFAANIVRIDRLVPVLAETTPEASGDSDTPPLAVVNAQMWLAEHLGLADTFHVNLKSAEEVQWPDVCLGLAEPGEVCATLPSDGWEIVFDVDNERYTLRTDSTGAEVRLASEETLEPGSSDSPLAGTSWQLVSLNGTPVISGSVVTLVFGTDGTASGQGGCNGYSGTYRTDGTTLTFSNIVSTLRACADNTVTAQEQQYLAVVNLDTTYSVSGNQLTIQNSGDTAVFTRSGSSPAPDEPLPTGWTRDVFGTAWDIAYPSGWTVNEAGAHEGAVELTGMWDGHSYKVGLSYPIGITQDNLDDWTAESLAQLTPNHGNIAVHSVVVGGTDARFARSVPLIFEPSAQHRVYVWRSGSLNPRLITFTQTDDQDYDAQAMADFAMLFLAQVRGGTASGGESPAEVPGIISFHADGTTGVIEAPETVALGESFEVTVNTFGGGCETAGQTMVDMTDDGATLAVFDNTTATSEEVVCTAILKRLPHTVSLSFDEAGEHTITVVGRRVGPETLPEGEIFTLEHTVMVE